jgi:hypothetical protein
MADIVLSEEFKRQTRARLDSAEGQKALDDFASSIFKWAVDVMPPDIREVLLTPEGIPELMKLWPDIVNGYFRAISSPGQKPRPKPKKSDKPIATTTQLVTEAQRLVASRGEW